MGYIFLDNAAHLVEWGFPVRIIGVRRSVCELLATAAALFASTRRAGFLRRQPFW